MFLNWDKFVDKFTQIFRDLKVIVIAEREI